MSAREENTGSSTDVAIVGMSVHFPGAPDVRAYWRNLRGGVESTRPFTDDELRAGGVAAEDLADPRYVKRGVVLEGMEDFDAEFFGFGPKEAAILDPQHRHFLECAWEALEDAGHTPESFDGTIATFGGCGMSSYFVFNLLTNPELVKSVGMFLLRHTGNDKDFLTTRAAYVLDLKGPAVNVQTACSTSLVAVHLAVQSLLSGECDIALAGGVTIEVPHRRGYVYEEGEILSPDGHCRAFDARSQGTIFGSGAGIVALRRLEDAIRDRDHVYAVIKGTAINNDGSGKVGYLAPSVDGQAAAIAEAISVADVDSTSIQYVECHGTGTAMGDPIEVAALTQAFGRAARASGPCGIGSVKTNIGHLDTAAGVASLVKVALALENGEIPPSLNWSAPNPAIDFASTPFRVVDALRPWPRTATPRRAGVNSLGVGGTNAYAVVEEARRVASAPSKRAHQLYVLSARNRAALDGGSARLAQHLREARDQDPADVAWTLVAGRRAFDMRRVVVAKDRDEAARLLETNDAKRVYTHAKAAERATVAFLLPGGGTQHARMGRDLYAAEPVFRDAMERGFALLRSRENLDLAALLLCDDAKLADAQKELERPSVQLPAIFLVEYALAQLWAAWGVTPTALIGHSMGENTAACLAGVISFEDALGLVALRGRLFERAPAGAMLSIALAADEVRPLLGAELDLAVVNAPQMSVVSGPPAAVQALAEDLAARGVDAQRIAITTAAHSRLVEPILAEFRAYLQRVRLSPPRIPFASNVTGTWITEAQATSPDYWVSHLRSTVRFSDGVRLLLEDESRILLEVGPGRTLASLARQCVPPRVERAILASLRHADDPIGDAEHWTGVYGRLWAAGLKVDLARLWHGEERRRVSLPTYAFQRQRCWIEPGRALVAAAPAPTETIARVARVDDWFSAPAWKPAPVAARASEAARTWLVFADRGGLGDRVATDLRANGSTVVVVRAGDAFARRGEHEYVLAAEHGRSGYDALVRDLVATGRVPSRVVHLWTLTPDESFRPGSSFFHENQERGYYGLLFLAQALGAEGAPAPIHVDVVTNGLHGIGGAAPQYPEKATLLGPVRVVPREFPGFTCASVDVELPRPKRFATRGRIPTRALDALAATLRDELAGEPANGTYAWRDGVRLAESYECASLAGGNGAATPLRERGVYVITGGLGGLGLVFARHLARESRARLVLISRSGLPERDAWDGWVRTRAADDPLRRRIEAVREIEELGGEVLALRADVTDLEDVRAALATARERFGAIHGVLHAAGVVKDALIATHDQSASEDVFAPKLHGTHVLDEVLADDELDFFALFSSTSAVTGPAGQVDYVAANAFLNAYAEKRSAERRARTVAIGWGVWSEVGMAADLVAPRTATSASAPVPLEASRRHPLLDARADRGGDETIASARWSPATHWVLGEHRTRAGHALLPGTGYLELASAALRVRGEDGPFEIRDLWFFRPLHVLDGETRDVRVRLRPTEQGYEFAVQSASRLDDGRVGWQTHAQALVRVHGVAAAARVDLAGVRARCATTLVATDEDGVRTAQEAHLAFGPRWRVLREARHGADEALARVELQADFRSDADSMRLHPALLDLATSFALPIAGESTGLYVPVSYGRVRVHAAVGPRAWSHARVRARGEHVRFDVVLCDDDGRVLMEVEDFVTKRVAENGDFALARRPVASELEFDADASSGPRPPSPAEVALRRNVELGITPAEGVDALRRILAGPRVPRVVVSSLDLGVLARQADRVETPESDAGPRFERPTLGNDYVAPRDEIERTLAGFWEELLGVGRVGVTDGFFDLGGHSLIAVRLFARIKRAWQVEYPISVLFEAPTIEGCAKLVRAEIEARSGGDRAASEVAERRYKHLVAMHSGNAGKRTPFFLVAGMFGNVLNLRHLAHLAGADRPVYGLQARGLYGAEEPHETFEQMALDYLAEIRTVQPRGPYLLGGFSGGGITAYEIARVLKEQGEDVDLLVMLDTPLPKTPQLSRGDRLVIHGQKLARGGPQYVVDWTRDKLRWKLARWRERDEPAPEPSEADFHSRKMEAAFRSALGRYDVKPLDVRVALFRPKLDVAHHLSGGRVTNRWRDIVFHDNGWEPYVGAVAVHEVPGDHDSMVLEPNVRVLASRLRRALDAAEARRSSPARG